MAIAIGMVEFSSIARGIYAADQMVKISEVEIVTAQTICPGKYIAWSRAMWPLCRIPSTLARNSPASTLLVPW